MHLSYTKQRRKTKIRIIWDGVEIENTEQPKYFENINVET